MLYVLVGIMCVARCSLIFVILTFGTSMWSAVVEVSRCLVRHGVNYVILSMLR